MENAYTHTLYYLAQVYGHLNDNEKSCSCCHATLHRQLATTGLDALEWAKNCRTLGTYYVSTLALYQVRYF